MTEATAPRTLIDVLQELEAMPEWETLERVRRFTRSLRLFTRNAGRLRRHLAFLTRDPRSLELMAVDRRAAQKDAIEEVGFHLHDFVAAAISLVDHARVFTTTLSGDGAAFPDLKSAIKTRFHENPLVQFVHCLRQFSQHYRLPNIQLLTSFAGGQLTRALQLLKPDLLEFSGWNAGAKRFLAESGEQIDIDAVVAAYEKEVVAFYEWVSRRQSEIHAPEINRLKEKRAEYDTLLRREVPVRLKGALDGVEAGHGQLRYVFSGVFGADDWRALPAFEEGPVRWAEAAITRLTQFAGQIEPDLVGRLRTLARTASNQE